MQLDVFHKTRYSFKSPPSYGLQQLRLTPKSRDDHFVSEWNIELDGASIEAEFTDFNNNYTHLIRLGEKIEDLSVICKGKVEITGSDGIWGAHEGFAPLWYFKRQTAHTAQGKSIKKLMTGFTFGSQDILKDLHLLSEYVLNHVPYKIGETNIETTAEMAVKQGGGVCQDHAHIFISCVRSLGHPARYVSGYLLLDDRIEQDASHAWAEVWVRELGWVGFDVSNQVSPDQKYIRVASGLDYGEASPISGLTFGIGDDIVQTELRIQQQ